MKTEMPSDVQWRATPSGSFREPVDYKGQERSNLIILGVSSFSSCSKTFYFKYPYSKDVTIGLNIGSVEKGAHLQKLGG